MPYKAARPCSHPGCPALVRDPRVSRCPKHQKEYEQRLEVNRPSAAARGYDARWREIRARFLADHPTCEKCGKPATVPHHIKRRREGGSDTPRNLMALCASCHSKLHARAGHSWNED
jgi:5-methylcytosine-specific restriction enzyme A